MENFLGFVKDFCVIAVAGGLVMLICPNGRLQTHVKFIISLCMICALLSSFLSVSGDLENFFNGIEISVENEMVQSGEDVRILVAKEAKKNMEQEILRLISSRFGFDGNEVLVIAEIDMSNMEAVDIISVTVFLSDIQKADAVKSYVSELFSNSIDVKVNLKGA